MQLKCPHCNTTFEVDKNEYAAILAQVRTAEFDSELERRLAELEKQHLAEQKARDIENSREVERLLARKERESDALKAELEQLKLKNESFESTRKADLEKAGAEADRKLMALREAKTREIAGLKADMEILKKQNELDIARERETLRDDLHSRDQRISELSSRLETMKVNAKNREMELNERHIALIRAKDAEIERYKDMRSRLSTKMLGETLEQHCLNMFNRARSQGQFLTAYFEKDNDSATTGTKGDFIFRDYVDGKEYISIMFEMKTEDDRTATKHRNTDFMAKLDKDRRDKGCEYAVLVSTLEADSEFYNEGIVDVSYLYDKMLVVRPQLFMAVIVMLSRTARSAATGLMSLQRELEASKAQSIDVTNFERRRDQFVERFQRLVTDHIKKQDAAMDALDKAIRAAEKQAEDLRKIKATFEASRSKLERANSAAENDFTIRKLTRGNPTMKAKFDEARRLSNEMQEGDYPDADKE